jgi:hypothetical protein
MRRLVLVAAVAATVLAPVAQAAPIHVIGSARASGEYAATNATGTATRPAALYVRAYGRQLDVSTAMTCSRRVSVGSASRHIAAAVSGRLYRLALPMARPDKCTVAATVIGAGTIRVQILAR